MWHKNKQHITLELNDGELNYAIFNNDKKACKLEKCAAIDHQSNTLRNLSKNWKKHQTKISIAIPYQAIIEKELNIDYKTSDIILIKQLKNDAKKLFLYPATKLYIDFYRHNKTTITAIAAKKSYIDEFLHPIINIIEPSYIDIDLYALARTVDKKHKKDHLVIMQHKDSLYLIIYKNGIPFLKHSTKLEKNSPDEIHQEIDIFLKIYNTKTSLLPATIIISRFLTKAQEIQKTIIKKTSIPCQLDNSHAKHLLHLGLAMRESDAI